MGAPGAAPKSAVSESRIGEHQRPQAVETPWESHRPFGRCYQQQEHLPYLSHAECLSSQEPQRSPFAGSATMDAKEKPIAGPAREATGSNRWRSPPPHTHTLLYPRPPTPGLSQDAGPRSQDSPRKPRSTTCRRYSHRTGPRAQNPYGRFANSDCEGAHILSYPGFLFCMGPRFSGALTST